MVNLNLFSKKLIFLDKLLLWERQKIFQASRMLDGFFSLILQKPLSLLMKGVETLDFLLQARHLLLGVLFLLFNGGFLTLHFLHGHTACGQSLPKLFHVLPQKVVASVTTHSFFILWAQQRVL